MSRIVDVFKDGKIVNRIELEEGANWVPPDGCEIRESSDSPFGDTQPPIPVVRSRANEIEAYSKADDASAATTRAFGKLVHQIVANVIDKHNTLTAILASGRFPTAEEAAALTIQVRSFDVLMRLAKQLAVNE